VTFYDVMSHLESFTVWTFSVLPLSFSAITQKCSI